MNKKVLSLIGIATLLALTPAAIVATSPWNAELVWGNDTVWQMVAPPGQGTHSNTPLEPLYIVAPQTATPQSPANNDHLPGVAHDHTLAPAPHNKGDYNPNWEVYVVVCVTGCTGVVQPAGSALPGVNLAQTNNGAQLTNDAAIQAGVASGNLALIDSGIHFICIVQPYR